jgi:hypothetical protein
VLQGKEEDYSDRLPTRDDCPLVIEVADTTLNRDRGIKRRIYARAGFSQYWIVSIPDRTIEVFTGPTSAMEAPSYAQSQRYGMSETLPVMIDGQHWGQVAVADVFPLKDAP